mgnify:FL=1
MKNLEQSVPVSQAPISPLDELARQGAQRMLAAALELEVQQYIHNLSHCRDEAGRALVVRNGYSPQRCVTIGSGTLRVHAPRVNDNRVVDGQRQRFTSGIVPPYLRRSQSLAELLPALYLRGLSTSDFAPALRAILGEQAALSPSTITRLISVWQQDYQSWRSRSLLDRDYVYVWADGVYFGVRLEHERLAALVLIGARADGTKEVIALEDGYRESKESWAELLRDLKRRGMKAPTIAVGDGALGFWAAVGEVFPQTREQRCWVHKLANVLDKLPKSLQPRAKAQLHQGMNAPTKTQCEAALDGFVRSYGAKYPKACASLNTDRERLLTLYDFPAEHWKHLRSTNPIESTFATVKHRQRATKGAGSRAAGLAMAFELMRLAQRSWRRLDAPHLLPQVRAGVVFPDGVAASFTPEQDPRPAPSRRRKPLSPSPQLRDAA